MTTKFYFKHLSFSNPVAILLVGFNALLGFILNDVYFTIPALMCTAASDFFLTIYKAIYVRFFNGLIYTEIFDRRYGYFTVLIGMEGSFKQYSKEHSIYGEEPLFTAARLSDGLIYATDVSPGGYNKLSSFIKMEGVKHMYWFGSIQMNGQFTRRRVVCNNEILFKDYQLEQ